VSEQTPMNFVPKTKYVPIAIQMLEEDARCLWYNAYGTTICSTNLRWQELMEDQFPRYKHDKCRNLRCKALNNESDPYDVLGGHMTKDPCDENSAIIVIMICSYCNAQGKNDATAYPFKFAVNTPCLIDPRCSTLIKLAEEYDGVRTRCRIRGDMTGGQGKLRPMAHKETIMQELNIAMSSLNIMYGSILLPYLLKLLESQRPFVCLLAFSPQLKKCGACNIAKQKWAGKVYILEFHSEDEISELQVYMNYQFDGFPVLLEREQNSMLTLKSAVQSEDFARYAAN